MTSKAVKLIDKHKVECPCQLDNILVEASSAFGKPDDPFYIDGFQWCETPVACVVLPRQGRDQLIARLKGSEQTAKQYGWLNEFVFEQYLNDNNWRYANPRDPSMGWWISVEDWYKIIDRCSSGNKPMDRLFFNRVHYQVIPTKDIKEQALHSFDTVIQNLLFPDKDILIRHLTYKGVVVFKGRSQDTELPMFALMDAEAESPFWEANNDTLQEEYLESTGADGLKKNEKLTLYIEDITIGDQQLMLLRPRFLSALMSLGCFKVLRNGKEYDIITDPYIQV